MRVVVGTYVDHLETVRYPVDVLTDSLDWCDQVYWFASDDENAAILRGMAADHRLNDRIIIVVLEKGITHPNDIGIAETASFDFMKAHDDADFIGYQVADEVLTPAGVAVIQKLLPKASAPFAISALKNQLYVELWHSPLALVLFPRDYSFKSLGDGWDRRYLAVDDSWRGIPPYREEDRSPPYMIDLGYMSTDAYYRKLVNHNRIWPDRKKPRGREAFDLDLAEGIQWGLENIARMTAKIPVVLEYSGFYRYVIDRLGLYADYMLVKSVAERMYADSSVG